MSFSIPQRTFLPPESIRLGRFVRDIEEPSSDFLDPDIGVSEDNIVLQSHVDYSEVLHQSKERTFKAMLTSLVSASRSKNNKFRTQIHTDQMNTYQLSNSGTWFRSAVNQYSGDDMYVVVGYHTMRDARILDYTENSSEQSAWLELPVEEALAAAGVGVLLGGVVNPGLQVQNGRVEGIGRRFVAVGEQICAVQYRKIHVKSFSSRDVDKTFLERNNCWKLYYSPRGPGTRGEGTGINDVVETDLEDVLDSELGSNYERHVDGTEEFWIHV
ncbi:hypothetical protein N7488_006086 [Penicillium malachiteum]|nr:hypothetical protein N7488_006086 [Penicillium malachiteum]